MDATVPSLRKFRGCHFLTDLDYTREELEDLLKLAVNHKALGKRRPLIPRRLVFPALLVLRRTFPQQPRPYTGPGGAASAWVNTTLREADIILTLFLFSCFPVEGTCKAAFSAITGGGTVVSLLIGWWLCWQASSETQALPRPAPTDA